MKIVLLLAVFCAAPVAAEPVFGIKKPGGGEIQLYPKRPCLISTFAKRDRIGLNSIEYHTVGGNIIRGCYRMENNAPFVRVMWEDGDTASFQLDTVYQKNK
jgi:hypothetical protein